MYNKCSGGICSTLTGRCSTIMTQLNWQKAWSNSMRVSNIQNESPWCSSWAILIFREYMRKINPILLIRKCIMAQLWLTFYLLVAWKYLKTTLPTCSGLMCGTSFKLQAGLTLFGTGISKTVSKVLPEIREEKAWKERCLARTKSQVSGRTSCVMQKSRRNSLNFCPRRLKAINFLLTKQWWWHKEKMLSSEEATVLYLPVTMKSLIPDVLAKKPSRDVQTFASVTAWWIICQFHVNIWLDKLKRFVSKLLIGDWTLSL